MNEIIEEGLAATRYTLQAYAAALRHQGLIKAAPEVRFAHLITGRHGEWFSQLAALEH